jgi:hypothetical protein
MTVEIDALIIVEKKHGDVVEWAEGVNEGGCLLDVFLHGDLPFTIKYID